MVVIMKKFLAVLLASLMMSGTIGAFADTLPEDAATSEIAETSEQQPVEKKGILFGRNRRRGNYTEENVSCRFHGGF